MDKLLHAALALTVAVLAAGCGDASADPEPGAAPGPATVDWTARTIELPEGAVPGGYAVRFCDGEAPLLCVSEGGEWLGVIELNVHPGGTDVLDEGIDAWVAEMGAWLAEDRRTGCDPEYQVAVEEAVASPVAGRDGWRYGFVGSIGDVRVERVVRHVTVVDDALVSLVLNGLADDGCLARESELPLRVAVDLEPVVAAIAAGSTGLPVPS